MAETIDYPCGEPDCIFCALHCPYCGQWPIVLEMEDRCMRCPACKQADELIHPLMIAQRHAQVLAISGRSIAEWKTIGRQLSGLFHHRWRTTMDYVDPAASAALSHADDLMIHGMPWEEAQPRVQTAKVLLQRIIDADPSGVQRTPDQRREPYPDDWY
jgi:hypothetical protein